MIAQQFTAGYGGPQRSNAVPEGRLNREAAYQPSLRDFGHHRGVRLFPAMNRWATVNRPSGTNRTPDCNAERGWNRISGFFAVKRPVFRRRLLYYRPS